MATHVFTSAAANYIPKVRVLAHSVKRFHPDFQFHLVLPDAVPDGLRLDQEPIDSILTVPDLGIEKSESWIFKHTLVELSTAVKGAALLKLLRLPGCSEVVYLDPDIVVLAPMDGLLAEFQAGSILFTPHLTEPEDTVDGIRDNELSALQHGVYNLGFLGVRNSGEGLRFARWWSDRLLAFCYDDIPRGIFTDQRWADLAPAYFPGCRILRDPVYNVCTWNLTHREVEGSLDSGLTVEGQRIVFYHFSGLDSGAQQAMLDKYGRRMRGLYELREWYVAECGRMEQAAFASIPWRYGYFHNGELVTDAHRRLYRDRADLQSAFPDPFATADHNRSYYHWYEANERTEAVPDGRPRELPAGGAGLRALTRHAQSLSTSPPTYRIFLSVTEVDAWCATDAAHALLERSQEKSGLFLIGSERALVELAADPELSRRFQTVPLPAGTGHDGAFDEVCRRFADRDFLFVKATTVVPDYWDVRLAWSLAGQQGIATVSPLCDRVPSTALDPAGDLRRTGGNRLSSEEVDRLCAHYSQLEYPELPRCLEDCVYVSADAARAAQRFCADAPPRAAGGFDRFHETARSLRYSHLLADHLYVGSLAPRAPSIPAKAEEAASPALLELRRTVRLSLPASSRLPAIAHRLAPRHLHIMHGWGGGLERWVQEYCRTSRDCQNFVLKSIGTWGAFGQELHLYRDIDDPAPIRIWPLYPSIKATVRSHAGYDEALSEIIDEFGIERILVSSLIGHSLEALRRAPPTLMVCHDYYPLCPALNVTFEELCECCEEPDLVECTRSNPHHRFFFNLPPAHSLRLRSEFAHQVQENRITMVAPSPSVRDNYVRFLPGLEDRFRIVPHGTRPLGGGPLRPGGDLLRRLRIVIPGNLAPHKGLFLFRELAGELTEFADIFLVGCGPYGEEFDRPGITVLPEYKWNELPALLERIQPDLGLLLSVVAETFSYSLQELFELGIPPVAVRVGSFADRIQEGVNGFLCAPSAQDVLARLRELARDRAALVRVHERLCQTPVRTLPEMLADYRKILDSGAPSAASYFCPDARRAEPDPPPVMCAQVFWRVGEEPFTESNSAFARFQPGPNPQAVGLRIPPLARPPDQLRLDLADQPGFLLLRRVRLCSRRREVLWTWDGEESLFSGAPEEIVVLGSRQDIGVLLCLTGEDPGLILPVGVPELAALKAGGTLELELSGPPGRRDLLLLATAGLPRNGSRMSAARLERLARQLDAVLPQPGTLAAPGALQAGRLAGQLSAAQARVAALETSWSWRLTLPLRIAGGLALKLARRLPIRTSLNRLF